MKRIGFLALCAALLFAGCGREEPVEASSLNLVSESAAIQEEEGYPTDWTETKLDFSDVGYVTARAEAFDGYDSVTIQNGALLGETLHGAELTLSELTPEGSVVREVTIARENQENSNISRFLFSEDALWAIETAYTVLDEETGDTRTDWTLLAWDLCGNPILELPLDERFPWGPDEEDPFPTLAAIDQQGRILIKTEQYLYALDEAGAVKATLDFMGSYYEISQDGQGNIYLSDPLDTELAYLLDQERFTIGQALFPIKINQTIVPGGGEYELYIIESGSLVGVDMDGGTLTTLVKWAKMGLVGAVNGVVYLDEDTLLLSALDIIINTEKLLTLTQMPASEVPEKDPVRVAYVVSDPEMGDNYTSGTFTQHAMNQFNRESSQYQVEYTYYASVTELQMEIQAGSSPDIILFNTYGEEYPSEQLFSRKGYLVDLEPLVESDPELSVEDFLPNVITAMKESNGGLYTMPLNFYFRTLAAERTYVGERTSWTTWDIYEIAKTLPEDMVVHSTAQYTLEYLLQHSINSYVDMENLTCDFTNETFYGLMNLSLEHSNPDIRVEMDALLTTVCSIGTLSNFAQDLRSYGEDMVFLGYPSAPGNGGDLVMMDCMGILTTAGNPEGAWEFLRTLYLPEIQAFASGLQLSIRKDLFYEENRKYMESHGVTEEEIAAAEAIVLGACSRTVYDNPAIDIVIEEAEAFFSGDKTVQEVAEIIENRVKIYLWEQVG